MRLVSLRSALIGELNDFLRLNKMTCQPTQDGLVTIIDSLSQYKEEGKALYPSIFITDELDGFRKMLPNFNSIKIDSGLKEGETIAKALKKCAPLTSIFWAIYILRKPEEFEYGIFTCGTSILSVSPEDIVIKSNPQFKAILIKQISEKSVEILSDNLDPLVVNFGIKNSTVDSLTFQQIKFIKSIVQNSQAEYRDQLSEFYQKVFTRVSQEGHGTLAATQSYKKKKICKQLSAGIILEQEIDIIEPIKRMKSQDRELAIEANWKLHGYLHLISGMLMSDLVTLFRDNGRVVGYNIFIKHPSQKKGSGSSSGGARTKTYEVLKSYLGNQLVSAYFQSQDGKTLADGI